MQLESSHRPMIGLALIALLMAAAPAGADSKALARTLSKDLGITEDQAIGGTQALLDVVKGNLGDDEFSVLLDGHADLFVVNGHVEPDIEKVNSSTTWKQPDS